MLAELKFKPYPVQEEYIKKVFKYDKNGYGGAAGGGKSYVLMGAVGMLLETIPGITIRAFRESRIAAEDNLKAKFLEIYPQKLSNGKRLYSYNKKEYTAQWHNGSKIIFDYYESIKYLREHKQGIEQDVLVIDEVCQATKEVIVYLQQRTRSNKMKPKFLYSWNWIGPGIKFIRKEFYEDLTQGQKIVRKIIKYLNKNTKQTEVYKQTYSFTSARLEDNEALMKSGYAAELMQLPEHLRRIYLDGDPYVNIGKHFSMFDEKTHTYQDGQILTYDENGKPIYEIQDHWKRYISLDYGISDYTAVHWYAIDEKGKAYVYREYYENGQQSEDVANMILERSKGEDIESLILPHDLFRREKNIIRDEEGNIFAETTADVFTNITGMSITRAHNAPGIRVEGWRSVARVLYYDKETMDETRVLIHKSCTNLIDQLENTQSNESNPEDIKQGQIDHEDALDSFRYWCITKFTDTTSDKIKKPVRINTPAYSKMRERESQEYNNLPEFF